jgi:predicted AAA+ superfamily ATPase
MIQRAVQAVLLERLRRFPAVALVGARQAGKTTLARAQPGQYFDLEQAGDRTRLDVEWDRLCAQDRLVVLDEAQSWPTVFPRLRGAIDADRKRTGRFLLLGSVSPALMTQVSESLAGRLSVVELTPFLAWEVPSVDLSAQWLHGGYPDGGILEAGRFPQWQEEYLALLAQRDLPTWGLPARPQMIDRLLRMTAAVHGQLWNASRMGQSLGLSHPTVNSYLDYLEGAFLVRRLRPYAAKLRKRLVRSAKLYWRDSGLLHALLRVRSYDDLLVQPWVGASWEGFVIEQIVATLAVGGRRFDPYFLRTSDGYQIDLLVDLGRERWAFEIKLTSQPEPRDLERLDQAAELVRAHKRIVVSQTRESTFSGHASIVSLGDLLVRLRERGAP